MSDIGLLHKNLLGFDNQRLAYDDVVARVCLTLARETLRDPVSSSSIEQLYRGDGLPDWVRQATLAAGEALQELLTQGSYSRPRLNKATLYSWLIFVHEAGKGPIYPYLVQRFEEDRKALKGKPNVDHGFFHPSYGDWFQNYLAVYNDRASYRVADTFSVLSRDLILHLANRLYLDSPVLLETFRSLGQAQTMEDAEAGLRRFIEEYGWGRLDGSFL